MDVSHKSYAHVGIQVKLDFILLSMSPRYKSLAICLRWMASPTYLDERNHNDQGKQGGIFGSILRLLASTMGMNRKSVSK